MAMPQALGGGPAAPGQQGTGGPQVLAPAGGLPTPGAGVTGARSLRRMARAITANRKATTGAVLLLIFTLVALFPGVIAHDDPTAEIYAPKLGPSAHHLLGTTALGQDMFAQVIYGTRPVLEIALGVGLGATVIATLIGVAAAYLGGLWDSVFNLLTDVLLVIPLFPLLIVISRYLGAGGAGTLTMIVVITATGWSYTARQLRSQALSLRSRDFLEAARVRGERLVVHRRSGDHPDDDLAACRQLPDERPLRGAVLLWPAVHRPRRPQRDQLGHHALLGREQ